MLENRENNILEIITKHPEISSKQIHNLTHNTLSYATTKRILSELLAKNLIVANGTGKATRYNLSPTFELLESIDLQIYFSKEQDERIIKSNFIPELITDTLAKYPLFTPEENKKLLEAHKKYKQNISLLSETEYKKELERLSIDLSWKSSQIEGNTYSLLETEVLLKEKQTAAGKTKEEAIMLLNHKEAIDFIIAHNDYLTPISVGKIEDIHRILVKELAIDKNIRRRRVGISGTNYQPLDNEYQIREALEQACTLINMKQNVFEKALLTLLLISYIQPFADGNKRTARIISNAILMHNQHCPLSFRTVDSIEYKKAMLLFYEQNNISRFKEIFINQFEFAVNSYF